MVPTFFCALGALVLAAGTAIAEYPEREMQGIIRCGAGGSTDTVTPHTEEVTGSKVVLLNVTGAVGAIALNNMAGAEPDGPALTAIMIGALFIHGLNPGPMLMIDQPDMLWFIVSALVMATVFMLIFGNRTA